MSAERGHVVECLVQDGWVPVVDVRDPYGTLARHVKLEEVVVLVARMLACAKVVAGLERE